MGAVVPVEVTRYSVNTETNTVESTLAIEQVGWELCLKKFDHRPDETWLFLNDGPWSLELTDHSLVGLLTEGWVAQAGTPPVYDQEEGWGGRNYPRYWLNPDWLRAGLKVLGIKGHDFMAAIELLSMRYGNVSMAIANGKFGWTVAIETGQEAPDSPMAGGAAYGLADTPQEALQQAFKDYKIPLDLDT